MKIIYLLLFISLFCFNNSFSQEFVKKMKEESQPNFNAIKAEAAAHFDKEKNSTWGRFLNLIRLKKRTKDEEERPGYEPYKRWEYFMQQRVGLNNSEIPHSKKLFEQLNQANVKSSLLSNERTGSSGNAQVYSTANWSAIGPFGKPSGGGAGRVNCIVIDPSNSSTLYLGTPAGGMWKSINGGTTWSSINGLYSNMGISTIAIDSINPNVIYAGTGDRDGGDTYSFGILKTIDGGVTWRLTNLNFDVQSQKKIYKILVNPRQPNIVIASTSNGIFRSIDAGINWALERTGTYGDLEFMPYNPNVVYASSGYQVWKSIDGGDNWANSSNGLSLTGANRLEMAVTPANPNVIYAVVSQTPSNGFLAFAKSTDAGVTWTITSTASTPNLLGWEVNGSDSGGQGWYDLAITAHPTSENTVYVGGVNIWKTINGGTTFSCNTHWYGAGGKPYVHADVHDLLANPKAPGTFYAGCDGGIFRTTNNGSSWSDFSNTMNIQQYYGFSCAQTVAGMVSAGAQDNGTSLRTGTSWDYILGGDGMLTRIDYTNEQVIYGSQYDGSLYRSDNGGNNFYDITVNGAIGAWVTPYILDPVVSTTVYAGYDKVYKSTNKGDSWAALNPTTSGTYDALAVAPSNTNYIYGATSGTLRRTKDAGVTWIVCPSPISVSNTLTGIAVDPTNPERIWITYSGYYETEKVFHSNDAGNTWTNITGILPNLPVNTIIYQKNSNDALYIGTDDGVYYRNANMNNWVSYNTGMPKVIVRELDIQYSEEKLRAATYGRGVWESSLYTGGQFFSDAGVSNIISPVLIGCNDINVTPVIEIKNYGTSTISNLDIYYKVNNRNYTYQWNGTLNIGSTQNVTLPDLLLPNGNYKAIFYTKYPNSTLDTNTVNDTLVVNFTTGSNIAVMPYANNFDASSPLTGVGIKSYDVGVTWALYNGVAVSGSKCLYMRNFQYMTKDEKDEFSLPALDLSTLNYPGVFFKRAYTGNAFTTSSDSLIVYASNDCGATFTEVYRKAGAQLRTKVGQAAEYFPTVTDFVEDTVSLTQFALQTDVVVKFRNINRKCNNLYVDDINVADDILFGIKKGLLPTRKINISPNPVADVLKINDLRTEGPVKIEIFDLTGKVLIMKEFRSAEAIQIRTTNLAIGIYTAKISLNQQIFVEKFSKE